MVPNFRWIYVALIWAVLGVAFASSAQARKFRVVTTFTVIADIAQNVAGDAAEVVSITKPGAEIHDY
ncbi:MAG: zinc ABC transporter substrate-binding protein, partial [Hyphomicrobiaceae bacterium]|nr:zinc ABC transporter substrate-binding protein [Hyphomicrobiaceae bacterium]